MASKDDAPPETPKSLSDYLKDPDFSKQVMEEIIDPNEHPSEGEPPLIRRPAKPSEDD
jgi:hypothetical protein